ncbi:MAG: hypothetical protein L0241_30035 [Planctomycetia bacterium]|nr:hypothetical protein [Planctomycetia bacterium]
MEPLPVKGILKNGQIVLETPLDLPDGTLVTVLEYDEDDYPREWKGPLPPEEIKQLMLALARRPDLADDPDWQEKIRRPRG